MSKAGYLIVFTSVAIWITQSISFAGSRIRELDSTTKVEHEFVQQLPAGCFDFLLRGSSERDCTAIGQSVRCTLIEGKKHTSCEATIKLVIDGASPKVSLFGTNCYPIAVTQEMFLLRGAPRKLEAIGQWCFTPSSNMIEASGMCVANTADGSILSVGDFKGTVAIRPGLIPTLSAIHNESAPLRFN